MWFKKSARWLSENFLMLLAAVAVSGFCLYGFYEAARIAACKSLGGRPILASKKVRMMTVPVLDENGKIDLEKSTYTEVKLDGFKVNDLFSGARWNGAGMEDHAK